jgi:DHA2 family multidrug resistance protein
MTAIENLDLVPVRPAPIGGPAAAPPSVPTPPIQPALNGNQSDQDAVSLKTWLAVIGANIGAFLAVLNIQIVNSSLADIQGAIGSGIDDGGWISTSYLVTEIVVIPLSAWLSRAFSVRRYLLTNTVLFLAASVACAFAHSLGQMIAWRALQGFFGGVLIPLAFTIIMTKLPRSKQPIGIAMFALSATFAPTIGPTIGGWLNQTYGWQYTFYVNLPPGLLMLAVLWGSLDRTPMQLRLLKEGDWSGIVTMAIGLAALQTLLEEGNKDDWFESPFILRLAVIAAVLLPLFVWIEFTKEKPLLNFRLFFQRNFAFGGIANSLMGTVLYGSTFVVPLYLSQMQGYNAEQIGEVLAWYGLPQLAIIPFVPALMKRVDPRLLAGFGLALVAVSLFMNSALNSDYGGHQLFLPNIVRALGQSLIMTPLAAITTAGIEGENAGSASSLFNMMRNLGGAIGIAGLQTFLTKREQYHSNILADSVSLFKEATRTRIDALTAYFMSHGAGDPAYARHEAIVEVGRVIRRQAFFMGYSDTFFLIGTLSVLAVVAVTFLKKASGPETGAAH